MKFRAVLQQSGKAATGVQVPAEVTDALGAGKRPAVRVTLGAFTYRSTVASMGGVFMLPVSAEVRAQAGVAAGDELEVEVSLDTDPREVSVPADLKAALDADERAVLEVEGAKTPETPQRRVEKVLAQLREG